MEYRYEQGCVARRQRTLAELTYKERLQPSLLDRLTDDNRESTEESRTDRVLSPRRLRACVRRDLAWLFNTTNLACLQREIRDYPLVEQSTLNYGVPDLTGRTATSINRAELEEQLRAAICSYEPRLLPSTVQVKVDVNAAEMSHNAMTFTIEGMLWAQPLPVRLFFKTALDLETGTATVEDLGKVDRG